MSAAFRRRPGTTEPGEPVCVSGSQLHEAGKIRHHRAPEAEPAVHDRAVMSIEKEGSGLPEVDVHKRTTKVNLSIVIGLLIFFAAMFSLVAWFWYSRS